MISFIQYGIIYYLYFIQKIPVHLLQCRLDTWIKYWQNKNCLIEQIFDTIFKRKNSIEMSDGNGGYNN